MGWMNPPMPWKEIERKLSDNRPLQREDFPGADGGDSPAWSRKRESFEPDRSIVSVPGATPYAELHCHSSFSFLDGASDPEDLVEEAARLGLSALAITDHDGFYAVPRFAQAARTVGLPTIFGAELTLGHPRPPKSGALPEPDPHGSHLLVLAKDPMGYAALARVISESQLAGEKTAPNMVFADIGTWLQPGEAQHLVALTGCRKGMVPAALEAHGPSAADREMAELVNLFGSSNVFVELWDHGSPLDSVRNDALVQLAHRRNLGILATNNVHYATPNKHRLAAAMAAVRARSSLDDIVGWLPPSPGAHLRSGAEQARRFARYPGAVELAANVGLDCAFDLTLVAPALPPYPTPNGMDEMGFLRHLVEEAGVYRYGSRSDEFVPGAWKQLDHELDLIEHLGFAGYFLVVWDIVEFCRRSDILCQGRGSAANSAVCYVLGITKADAVSLGLLFERFLAPERDGPPDIDLDIESDRREEAIQYVYERHGRRHAAQVANVITYRAKSAVRDAAKALGYAPGQQDAFSKSIDRWSGLSHAAARRHSGGGPVSNAGQASLRGGERPPEGGGPVSDRSLGSRRSYGSAGQASLRGGERPPEGVRELPDDVLDLAVEFEDLPRHLGIHSGGMVMCDRPVIEVCPVEWGRMKDRTVLQWDKEDCAIAGLVKFDLLGLGMLSALHYAIDMIEEHHGTRIDLAALPQEEEVYEMLCRADSVGVFQVESRAQMSTLPRLKPRNFYDLVVEIALIRPGPIQGGSVHPYIRRRNGEEPVTYLHPLLKPALEKTLGIPLFQEQLMQMAIDVSGFTPSEADELRRAMGSKRSVKRMLQLQERLYAGMAERDVEPDVQEQIWVKLVAFANYGFPESHSISFAYLVYASSWIKLHYPAAFCAALLNAQPMGFYSPHSLVQDARRHGVATRSPDINASGADAELHAPDGQFPPPEFISELGSATWPHQFDHGWAVRLGIGSVRGIGEDMAETIATNRPYTSIEQLVRKTGVTKEQVEAMATAGCFDSFGSDRRQALWTAGAVAAANKPNTLPGIVTGVHAPQLPGMGKQEEALADLWATRVAAEGHPTIFLRPDLDRMGALRATELASVEHGQRVMIGGVVTHRQRPATASGVTFMGLEDETGLMNVVVSVGCWARFRRVARNNPALIIRGRLERTETGATPVINIVAERMDPLKIGAASMSRDFR
ncbi:MAG: error-prone DNA polymerase [Acidimicrobiales bacterium]|nr:error-prone DNA polymerase [Acidimicrobiales bacterium]